VSSEEAVNRPILIPNAMLFSQVVIDYTARQDAAFILDEVVTRITYDTDWDEAERVLLTAAREVTGEIIAQTGQEPYVRSEMYDYGV
jgi:small-conductance mechanosensitive channel